MGLSESLGNVYMKVEDTYYGVLDFFEEKGIGIPWAANDFLETKGIPALPFIAALLLVVLGAVFWVATSNQPTDVEFTLSLKDENGDPLYDVNLRILDDQGNVLKEMTASNGQTVSLSGIKPNSELIIEAQKEGYGEKSVSIFSSDEKIALSLKGTNDAVVGKLKLVDSETLTTITDATITAEWSGGDVPVTTSPGDDGIILLNVPLNKEISITIKAPNYEDLYDVVTFSGGDVKTKELVPKAGASSGPSIILVKAIDGTTQLPLTNVHILIENVQTGELISDLDSSTGLHSENLTKGTVVRVSVSKEGYLTYSTNTDFPGGKTLRNEEETIIATLENGGVTLTVIAQNQSNQQPLQGVNISLLDNTYESLESQTTTFSGDAQFGGLNQTNQYYLLAFQSNFFPERVAIDWSTLSSEDEGKTIILGLSPFTSANAGIMTAFVNENDGAIATSTTVRVEEKLNGEYIPLVSKQSVDSVGSFSVRLPVGTIVRVTAEKEDGSASASHEVTIVQGLNKVVLDLESQEGLVTFNLKFSNGQAFAGNLRVEDTGKGLLFNEAVTVGSADVGVGTNTTVYLTATSMDGKTYTQTVNVAGKETVDIVLDSTAVANGTAPEVAFIGLFNANGEPIPGLAPESEAFARFSVKWPASSSMGGILVRVGSDSIVSVDAQYLGIVGVNADASKVSYGKSWTPTPKPGNESKDRKSGMGAGTFSKWVEIVNENPVGSSTFDVQIKTKKGIPTGTQEIKYRAFATIGNQLIRSPADSELGFAPYVSTKSGLYATTQSTTVPVYESMPLCQNGICVSISFVDKENRVYSIANAQAMTGQPYAIEVTVLPGLIKNNINNGTPTPASTTSTGEGLVPLSAIGPAGTVSTSGAGFQNPGYTLKAVTSGDEPLLVFTKTEVTTFGKLEDTGKKDTSISTVIPPSLAGSPSRARIHFLPEETGQTTIEVQLTSSSSAWNQTIPLEIVNPRYLTVAVPDKIEVGESIPIHVNDDQGNPIENAQIILTKSDGTLAASLKGKGILSKGENGSYVIDKSLDAGLYGISVQVPGFVDFTDGIAVGIDSPLQLPEKIEIIIPVGQTKVTQNVLVVNKTGAALSNLTGELSPFENFPNSFLVEVGTIPGIPANGKANLPITVTYTGSAEDIEVKVGVGQLKVHGEAGQKMPVLSAAQLSIIYNKQLDSSCLKFNKTKLSVVFNGDTQNYGSAYTNGTLYNQNAYYSGANQSLYDTGIYNNQGVNNYGYYDSGLYQNAENKRVNVKVKNDCGEELLLIPGISTVDGQVEVDGLKVAAVDSSFKLLKGQEKQVDFTITNDLFRTGYGNGFGYGTGYGSGGYGGYGGFGNGLSGGFSGGFATPGQLYQVNFRAPQLAATLPLEVVFSDRSRAIQAPSSLELNLIKSGNTKATDRVAVPITNIGTGVVYDIQAKLTGGDKPTDISLKIENANQSSATNVSYGYTPNNALQPGQTLFPPLAIVGESATDKVGLYSQKLEITGLMDGRRTLMRTIDVFVRTGGTSCLEISAFDTPVSFISSEITGTLSKRITVRNKCLEPVQITSVFPESLSGNSLAITPVIGILEGESVWGSNASLVNQENVLSFADVSGSLLIEKDAEEEFNIVLTKGNALKNQFSATVKGIMVLSQKPVESNPLPFEIAIGAGELEHSNTTNGIEVPVCEGGTTNVRFPLLAKKAECSQAYCDAEQASNMISQLVEQQIAKAVQLMQSKKNDASQFAGCDITERYCTFSQLGIKSPSIDLYLQNDNLSSQMLEYVMRDGTYPRLSRIQSEPMTSLAGEGADESFAQRLGTGLGNKLFLAPIQGCGKYTISIIGGVEIVTNQLQSDDGINIGIKVNSNQKTAECQDKIYNAAVFLPKDRSLTLQNSHQTLLGVVKYSGTELQEPSKWLAEEVFGSDTRATTNTGSNHLDLRVGNLSQSIVELTLDPATSGSVPKRIIATVRKTQGNVEKEAIVEAGKIITSLGQSVNGCITQNEQTWRIYSVKDVGQFTYEGCALNGTPEGGLAIRSAQSCCMLTTKSDIQSTATYDISPIGNDPIPGVKELNLYEKDPTSTPSSLIPGSKISPGAEYPLVFDTKNQIYVKELLLCGISDPTTQQQANKAPITASAIRALDGSKAGPLTFQLRTCTLDADDALAKAYEKDEGTYYATIDWSDAASQKTLKQVIDEAVASKKVPNAFFSYQDQGIIASDNPVYQEKYLAKQDKSLIAYGTSCMLACGACTGAVAIFSGGLGASLLSDCLLGCGIGTGVGLYSAHSDEFEEDSEGTALEIPVQGVNMLGAPGGAVLDTLDVQTENRPGASAVEGMLFYQGVVGLKRWDKLSTTNDKTISAEQAVIDAKLKKAVQNTATAIEKSSPAESVKAGEELEAVGREAVQHSDEVARATAESTALAASRYDVAKKLQAELEQRIKDIQLQRTVLQNEVSTLTAGTPIANQVQQAANLGAAESAARDALDNARIAADAAYAEANDAIVLRDVAAQRAADARNALKKSQDLLTTLRAPAPIAPLPLAPTAALNTTDLTAIQAAADKLRAAQASWNTQAGKHLTDADFIKVEKAVADSIVPDLTSIHITEFVEEGSVYKFHVFTPGQVEVGLLTADQIEAQYGVTGLKKYKPLTQSTVRNTRSALRTAEAELRGALQSEIARLEALAITRPEVGDAITHLRSIESSIDPYRTNFLAQITAKKGFSPSTRSAALLRNNLTSAVSQYTHLSTIPIPPIVETPPIPRSTLDAIELIEQDIATKTAQVTDLEAQVTRYTENADVLNRQLTTFDTAVTRTEAALTDTSQSLATLDREIGLAQDNASKARALLTQDSELAIKLGEAETKFKTFNDEILDWSKGVSGVAKGTALTSDAALAAAVAGEGSIAAKTAATAEVDSGKTVPLSEDDVDMIKSVEIELTELQEEWNAKVAGTKATPPVAITAEEIESFRNQFASKTDQLREALVQMKADLTLIKPKTPVETQFINNQLDIINNQITRVKEIERTALASVTAGTELTTFATEMRQVTTQAVTVSENINASGLTNVVETKTAENIVKETPKTKRTTGFFKQLGRGLICGGIGNTAGYLTYRDMMSDEIENKIVLNAGNSNVLDPTSNNVVFQKGQTYAFTVNPTEGEGKSREVSIELVPANAQVNGANWLDVDCSGQ